ncbi:toprim domain-containing protein [bacterium]|nr:toprim domain-containing protein [bacterium]
MFLDDFVEKCHINLLQPSSKIPLAYLVSRGISLKEIKKYKLGYSPTFYKNPDKEEHEEAEHFNSWLGWKGRFIKNRLVFPIHDEMNGLLGIETRGLDKRAMSVLLPKFKNNLKDNIAKLPETEVRYKKFYFEKNRHMATFFGLPEGLKSIWETKEVYLTEGIFDMLSLNKIKPNCLTPLTANINEYQITWLKRYVNKVILLFDMDEKGKKAVKRLKYAFKDDDIQVHSIPLKSRDVNEFVMTYGQKELELYLNDKLDTIF